MDLTRLDQEKKKWRREWELEQQAARPQVSTQEVRDSIERKIEAVRQRVEADRKREWEALSDETREAWQHFEALKARDLDALKQRSDSASRDAQPLLESGDRSAISGPQGRPAARSVCEDIAPTEAGAENKDSPKVRKLTDDGWE